jgi:hypothetical protein
MSALSVKQANVGLATESNCRGRSTWIERIRLCIIRLLQIRKIGTMIDVDYLTVDDSVSGAISN